MKKQCGSTARKGAFRYTKEFERRFFFYATIAMFLLYGITQLLGE